MTSLMTVQRERFGHLLIWQTVSSKLTCTLMIFPWLLSQHHLACLSGWLCPWAWRMCPPSISDESRLPYAHTLGESVTYTWMISSSGQIPLRNTVKMYEQSYLHSKVHNCTAILVKHICLRPRWISLVTTSQHVALKQMQRSQIGSPTGHVLTVQRKCVSSVD